MFNGINLNGISQLEIITHKYYFWSEDKTVQKDEFEFMNLRTMGKESGNKKSGQCLEFVAKTKNGYLKSCLIVKSPYYHIIQSKFLIFHYFF